jgi:transcriptional regulator with XRE-family HTH domain
VSAAKISKDQSDSSDFEKSLQTTAIHIDNHVGQRLRQRRQELGLSQTAVADQLEVTFQQVQKYERGMNRISASRLHDLCGILNVPVEYFFDGLEAVADEPDGPDLNDPELMELVDHYMLIPRQITRARLSAMLRAVGRWVG